MEDESQAVNATPRNDPRNTPSSTDDSGQRNFLSVLLVFFFFFFFSPF